MRRTIPWDEVDQIFVDETLVVAIKIEERRFVVTEKMPRPGECIIGGTGLMDCQLKGGPLMKDNVPNAIEIS